MSTSIKTRAAAIAVSILVTLGAIDLMADYAYPLAPAVLLASATR